MKLPKRSYSVANKIMLMIVVASVYFFVGQDGFWLAIGNDNVITLVSTSGIALAAVLLLGNFIWPGILLGALIYNFVLFYSDNTLSPSTIYFSTILVSIGSTCQAVLGDYLIRRFCNELNPFEKTQDVFRFVFITLFICLTTATINSVAINFIDIQSRIYHHNLWFSSWISEVSGIFLFVPFLIGWGSSYKEKPDKRYFITSSFLYFLIILIGGII